MSNFNYIIKRILQIIPVMIIVTILVFFLIRLIPGNPAQTLAGPYATREAVAALEKSMGLDKPLIVQFGIFVKNILHFDFGNSYQYKQSVASLLKDRIVVTLCLAVGSTLCMVLMSVPLGYIAAANKDRLPDQIVRAFTLMGMAFPNFWLAIIFMIVFCITLKALPITAWGADFGSRLRGMILPCVTLAIANSAMMIRNLRNDIIDVQESDYVLFARSTGLNKAAVRSRYIVRNAMIPFTTLTALRMVEMLGGSIVIENVFSLPGIGSMLVGGILARDYAVVQAVVIFYVFVVQIANLITDIIYSFLDPRVKLQ